MFATSPSWEPLPRLPDGAERVMIPSATPGVDLEAWLFEPAPPAKGKAPLMTMWHGVGGRKDFGLQVMGRDLARAGCAALAVDFRNFGGSGGEPRNLIDPMEGAEDMLTVLRWARREMAGRFDTSRVGLLGCSMGGGVAVAAAVRAEKEGIPLVVVSYVGAILPGGLEGFHAKTKEEQAYFDACVLLDSRKPGSIYLPTVERHHLGTFFEGTCFLKNYAQAGCIMPPELDQVRNHPPARSYALVNAGFSKLKPHRAVRQLRAPLLHIMGEYDQLVASGSVVRKLLAQKPGAPAEIAEFPCEHNSVYPLSNPAYYERIKAWMGSDRRKLYKPHIYHDAIAAVARFAAEQFAAPPPAAASRGAKL